MQGVLVLNARQITNSDCIFFLLLMQIWLDFSSKRNAKT
jgi:hypothetical protein